MSEAIWYAIMLILAAAATAAILLLDSKLWY